MLKRFFKHNGYKTRARSILALLMILAMGLSLLFFSYTNFAIRQFFDNYIAFSRFMNKNPQNK